MRVGAIGVCVRTARRLAAIPGVPASMAAVAAILVAITGTHVGQGVLVAVMLAAIFDGDGMGALWWPLLGFVTLSGVRALLLDLREQASLRAAHRVSSSLRGQVSDRLFDLGPGWLQRSRTGTMQSTMVDGVDSAEPYVGRFLPQVVATVIGAIALTTTIVVLDPLVGGIVLLCAALTPIVPIVSGKLMDRRIEQWWASYNGLYADNLDALQGMSTLKAFNASRRRGAELKVKADEFCNDSIRVLAWWGAYLGVVGLAGIGGTAVAVGLGAVHTVEGSLSTTQLLLILMLTRECFRPLRDLESAFHAAWAFRTTSVGLFEFLDARPDVTDTAQPASLPDSTGAPAVDFEDVEFCYPSRTEPALRGLSLHVAPGERVALVGRSGAGKTTVISLLLRFFDVSGGRIRIDGVDIRELPLAHLRSLVAVVSQDSYLFHGTVRENLELARPGADTTDIVAAATAARAHEFITALPAGYDTVIGERGVRLSGGERQRLAIARALLADARILVLDEATSSLDAANEAAIVTALEEVTRGRTTIVIAHRLSTVRDADRLVVLADGVVIETGDHDGLVAGAGAYARLVAAQGAGASGGRA